MGTVELAEAGGEGEEVLQERCRRCCQLADTARKSRGEGGGVSVGDPPGAAAITE